MDLTEIGISKFDIYDMFDMFENQNEMIEEEGLEVKDIYAVSYLFVVISNRANDILTVLRSLV